MIIALQIYTPDSVGERVFKIGQYETHLHIWKGEQCLVLFTHCVVRCFLCRQFYEKFKSIYEVTQDVGHLVISSPEMESKVFEWMAHAHTALEDVTNQVNVYVKQCLQ